MMLGQALLHAGDISTACIALAVTMQPLEESRCLLELSKSGDGASKDASSTEKPQKGPAEQRHDRFTKASPSSQLDISNQGPALDKWHLFWRQDAVAPLSAFRKTTPPRDTQRKREFNANCVDSAFYWLCDGPCNRPPTSYAELHFCRICSDVCLCEICIGLVLNDIMPFRECARDHPHV